MAHTPRLGSAVRVLHLGPAGTTLTPARITSVRSLPAGGWEITTERTDGGTNAFRLDRHGRSDYVLPGARKYRQHSTPCTPS